MEARIEYYGDDMIDLHTKIKMKEKLKLMFCIFFGLRLRLRNSKVYFYNKVKDALDKQGGKDAKN